MPRSRSASPPRLPLPLLGVVVACAVVVLALYRVFVLTRRGQLTDIAAMGGHDVIPTLAGNDLGFRAHEPVFSRLLDVVSVSSVALALASAVLIGLLRGRWRSAVAALVLVGGATLTTEVLKHDVFSRPFFGHGTSNTLPSGHTTVAASIAAMAVLVCPRRLRPFVALAGAAYAVLTGVAVVHAAWHRPSDAMAAYAVVLGWCALTAALVLGLSRHAPGRPGAGHQAVAVFLGGAGGVLGALSAALMALVAQRVPVPAGGLREVAAYAGGTAGITAGGLLSMAVWLLVVPFVDSATSVPPAPHPRYDSPGEAFAGEVRGIPFTPSAAASPDVAVRSDWQ